MARALEQLFTLVHRPLRGEEVGWWIDKNYPKKWQAGTLAGHLYGCRVNDPMAFKHHKLLKKFLFLRPDGRYELYDAEAHGIYENGALCSDADDPSLGWILVHSEQRYGKGDDLDNPIDELAAYWPKRPGNLLWHWTRSKPLRESDETRRLLLAWKQEVFGEATATVTHKIEEDAHDKANFAFRLSDYQLLRRPIPFGVLRLGTREHQYRDLIRLDSEIWEAYELQKRSQNAAQPEVEIEACLNPQKVRQGYGLTAKERQCVELHAMEVAKAYLVKEGYGWKDVSGSRPFDYLATKGIESLSVEVKGTTGLGDKILLTANEVKHQRAEHPRNMLIVVHSIRLERGDTLKASGGVPQVTSPWLIKENNLEPTAYAYTM